MARDVQQNARGRALSMRLTPPAGEWYVRRVPDTLDLVAHASLGLNGLSGVLDPTANYEFWWWVRYAPVAPEPMLEHHALSFAACGMKLLESFPLLLTMTGSRAHDEGFNGLKNLLVSWIDDDGLLYCPVGPERPWDRVASEDYANVYGQSRMMLAMMALYQVDRQEAWLDLVARMSDALCRIAVDRGDYAYYPVSMSDGKGRSIAEGYCWTRSGWYDTSEAASEAEGQEGSMFVYHQGPIRALTRWYAMSGDRTALEMAGKLARYATRSAYWGTPFDWPLNRTSRFVGADRAHFTGHFHGHAAMLFALAQYANAAHDARLKEFARSGYEYLRNFGIGRIGLFGESCTISDMIATAIRLSEGGVGDYWDDVDGYLRNQLIEQQFADPAELLRVHQRSCAERGDAADPEARAIIQRTLGVFADDGDLGQIPEPASIQCCTGNGTQGLYYAWESAVRSCGEEGVEVNLLLNRASSWMDVASHLPYEGKVVLTNKTARWLSLRIPVWVDRGSVRCTCKGAARRFAWIGSHARVEGLVPADELVFSFPVAEQTARYTCVTRQQWTSDPREDANPPGSTITYTCTFRGGTLVDVSPRPDDRWYANYRRDHYRADHAPTKEAAHFVADRSIAW